MIDAAIVGLGWWGRIIHRELAVERASSGRCSASSPPTRRARRPRPRGSTTIGPLRGCAGARRYRGRHPVHAAQASRGADRGGGQGRQARVLREAALHERARDGGGRASRDGGQACSSASAMSGASSRASSSCGARLAAGELGTALLMEGNFSQDKFLALARRQLAPLGRGRSRRAAVRHRHPSRRPVDCAPGQAQRGVGAARHARQPVRQRRHAGRHDCLRIGRQRHADRNIGNPLHRPHRASTARRGGWRSATARIPSIPPDGTSPSRRAARSPATHFLPPHPAVRDNLEAFGRAVAGQAPYPVSLAEIDANVRTFEAITRSAQSGKLERV